jgi:predicted TPR repeat methyltransferase
MKRLREEHGCARVIEVGCGFGFLTNALRQEGFSALGIDVAETAIAKARIANPDCEFRQESVSNFSALARFDPDVFLMAEITWYILEDLDRLIENLREFSSRRARPTFLIHLLTTYSSGVQQYGKDKFTNLDEIVAYFGFEILESGFIRTPRAEDPGSQGTYFVARV